MNRFSRAAQGRWHWAALALFILALATGCGPATPVSESKPEVGYLAPDFELPDVSGAVGRLSDLRGKAVVLNFWATWCGPCRAELPTLKSLAQREKGRVVVVGVNEGEPAATVREFVLQNQMNYTILLDPRMSLAGVYDVRTIPLTLVIDRRGVIIYRRRGILIPGELDLALKTALK